MLTTSKQTRAIAIEWNFLDSLFLGPCWIIFSVCLPDILSKFLGPDGGWVQFTGGVELLMIASPNFYQEAVVVVIAKKAVYKRWGGGLIPPNTLEGCNGSAWPGACFSFLFLANVAQATATEVPPSPTPLWREGLIRGSLGAMIPFYLNWLVCGCFLAKK